MAVILAAGQGTRMKSRLPKMLHTVAGRPMIDAVFAAARACSPTRTVVVVGHAADELRRHLAGRDVEFAVQPQQLGTGDAVRVALEVLPSTVDDIMVLFGDHPLTTPGMVQRTLETHRKAGALATMAICVHPDGGQHGRVARDERGRITGVTEWRDVTSEVPGPKEINSGIHCFRANFLAEYLPQVRRQPHGEYYLTDLIALAASAPSSGAPWPVAGAPVAMEAAMGVNDRVQLADAERIARANINEHWMRNGVTLLDPATTLLDHDVTIGRDTVVGPFTVLAGPTSIGEECQIGPGARIYGSRIGDQVRVVDSTVEQSTIGAGADLGPYAHLRPGSVIEPGVHIGNFAEVKNARIGRGTNIGHCSYIGDADVGERVNIGAGTITCNYDGRVKHRTIIEDGAFVGSDTMFVAPVSLGAGASTGAGAVVTRDVPAGRRAVGVPARLMDEERTPRP